MARKTVSHLNDLKRDFTKESTELELCSSDVDSVLFELTKLTVDDIRYSTEHETTIKVARKETKRLLGQLAVFEESIKLYKEFF